MPDTIAIRIHHHFSGPDMSPADRTAIRDAMAAALFSHGRQSMTVNDIEFPVDGGAVILSLTLGDTPGQDAEAAYSAIDWDAILPG